MNLRRVSWGIGGILVFFSFTFVIPILFAFGYDLGRDDGATGPVLVPFSEIDSHVPRTAVVFLITALLTATLGLVLQYWGEEEANLRPREGYAIVGISWLLIALFGAIPFYFLAGLTDPVDAFFESMSGFTTTGASTMAAPLEQYPASLMVWRSLEQWLGGMGIIVLTVALLAQLTQGGHNLMSAEAPGINLDRLRPKLAQTAKALWSIYLGFTVFFILILVVLMHFTGVRLPLKIAILDAVIHVFAGMSTGGFSNHDASIAFFDSIWVDVVFFALMVIAGINFSLYYRALDRRDILMVLRDPETRTFVALVVLASCLVAFFLWWEGGFSAYYSVRYGFLQTVSLVTSTGFTPVEFDAWPETARFILFLMLFPGGAAGSTTGGMKIVRLIVLAKLVRREIKRLRHPRAIIPLRLGSAVLDDETVKAVAVFFFTYVAIVILSSLVLIMLGMDIVSATSAVGASIGNIGPGLGTVNVNYIGVPPLGKMVLAFNMWVGRLEIFTVLILLFPTTWRR